MYDSIYFRNVRKTQIRRDRWWVCVLTRKEGVGGGDVTADEAWSFLVGEGDENVLTAW